MQKVQGLWFGGKWVCIPTWPLVEEPSASRYIPVPLPVKCGNSILESLEGWKCLMHVQWSVRVGHTPQLLPGHADMEEKRGAQKRGSIAAHMVQMAQSQRVWL